MVKRKRGESPEHKKIKEKIQKAFKKWYGCTLKEYNEAGHRLDVFTVLDKGTRIIVEIIWNESEVHYYKDTALTLRAKGDVKIVIGSDGIISKFSDDYSKTVASQKLEHISINNEIIPATKLLRYNKYLNNDFKKIVDNLIKSVNKNPSISSITEKMLKLTNVNTKIIIERNELLDNLEKYVKNNSGIVIGSPGVGKTFTIKKLSEKLSKENTPILYIPIDKNNIDNDLEFEKKLGIKDGNITDYLTQQHELYGKKGIIFFDSFDSARSDKTQSYYLNLITELKSEIIDKFNIVVSVRVFDARKSQKLLEVFNDYNSNEFNDKYNISGIKTNHFSIKQLQNDEVVEVLKTYFEPLFKIYDKLSSEFKLLLRTPFNLWLVEKILENREDEKIFTTINSRVDLLDLYWKKRIDEGILSEKRKAILTNLTKEMVENKSLNASVFNDFILYANDAWLSLLSTEVIIYSEDNNQKVSYSHNVLFDFAVSKLLMPDDINEFKRFISEDLSRPIFLRPSMDYYFARIWYKKRKLFWEMFWDLLPNENISIRIFARIIPTGIIIQETKEIDELEPIIDKLGKETIADQAVQRILQAYRVYDLENSTVWLSFFEKISIKPSITFAWELGSICFDILAISKKLQHNESISVLGIIFRNLLNWALNNRNNDKKNWYDRFISSHTIRGVTETYSFSIEESKRLLTNTLKIIEEENFEIMIFFSLTENIESIAPYDVDFTIKIYESIFGYEEKSQEKTNMGTQILQMTSNRRQDYESCNHQLIDFFPSLLKMHPLKATILMINLVNDNVINNEVIKYNRNLEDIEHLIEKEIVNGENLIYIPDMSYIWDQDFNYDYFNTLNLSKAFFEFLIEVSNQNKNELIQELVKVLIDKIKVAYLWKHLFDVGSMYPHIFKYLLFDLCKIKIFYIHSETNYEIGKFISSISIMLSKQELIKVEEVILSMPEDETDLTMKEYLIHDRNKMLSCIPKEKLQLQLSINIIDELIENNKVPVNIPYITMENFESKVYTDKDYFKDQGVDLNKPDNQNVEKLYRPIQKINRQIQNRNPNKNELIELYNNSITLFNELKNNLKTDIKVRNKAWTELAGAIVNISSTLKSADCEEYKFCRTVALDCAQHELPKVNEKDTESKFPSWDYLPRNEIARILPYLYQLKEDDKLANSIETLVYDPSHQVRMLITRELYRLEKSKLLDVWGMMSKISEDENNSIVLVNMLISLNYLLYGNIDKSVSVLSKLKDRVLKNHLESLSDVKHNFLILVTKLLIYKDNNWAKNVFEEILKNPNEFSGALKDLTRILDEFIVPQRKDKIIEKALNEVSNIINSSSKVMKKMLSDKDLKWDENNQSKFRDYYGVIDNLVRRFYFNAEIKSETHNPKVIISDAERSNYYFLIKSTLQKILNVVSDKEVFILFAPTAHYFMQLLNGVVKYDPRDVVIMASTVIRASQPYNFNFDDMATREIVKLVETILADYKKEIQDDDATEALLYILDVFAETGWPSALKLIWRLDEIYR